MNGIFCASVHIGNRFVYAADRLEPEPPARSDIAQRRAYTHWRATPRHARFRGPIAVFGDAGL